jgi:hypothetical protein
VDVLYTFAQCGPAQCGALTKYELTAMLVHTFLDETGPTVKKPQSPRPIAGLLLLLVQSYAARHSLESASTTGDFDRTTPPPRPPSPPPLEAAVPSSSGENAESVVGTALSISQAFDDLIANKTFISRILTKDPRTAELLFKTLSQLSETYCEALISVCVEQALKKSHPAIEEQVVSFLNLLQELLLIPPPPNKSILANGRAGVAIKPLIERILHIQSHPIPNAELFIYHCSKILLKVAAQQEAFRQVLLEEWQKCSRLTDR